MRVWLAAWLTLAGCDAVLESDLTAEQADRVVVALDRASIGASKDRVENGEGYEVRVATTDTARAISVLRESELPRREDPGMRELFAEASLVPTVTEERARFTAALSGELARSIETIDGVLDARVHLGVPETRARAYDAPADPARASVLVKRRRGVRIDEAAIRQLVAFAVPGMRTEDVAVVAIDAPAPTQSHRSLAHLGPIAVAEGSLSLLRGIAGISLAIHAGLAIALAVALKRLRART